MTEGLLKPNTKTSFFIALLKFCTTNQLFKSLGQRYTEQQIAVLNDVVQTRGKIHNYRLSSAFLWKCIFERVAPKFITHHLKKSRVRHSPEMERAFLSDEVERLAVQSKRLQRADQSHWHAADAYLSFFDRICFCK